MSDPGQWDIYIYQNTVFSLETTYKDADGSPYDVSLFEGSLVIFNDQNSYEFDQTDGIIFGDVDGKIYIELKDNNENFPDYTGTYTNDMKAGNYRYAFNINPGTGFVPYLTGNFKVSKGRSDAEC